ncbi:MULTISPECIES: hypothetical protein [unclassified Blastococcus]
MTTSRSTVLSGAVPAPWWAPPLALLAAARVGLSVHHPHDVVDGLVLGALVASALVVPLRRVATRWVTAAAGVPVLHALFDAARWPTESEAAPSPSRSPGGRPLIAGTLTVIRIPTARSDM